MSTIIGDRMKFIEKIKQRVKQLRNETYTLYVACKDPRVSLLAKILISLIVGYAFSPIDLIPDFIPFLGQIDDLILISLGITIVRNIIPQGVLNECKFKVKEILNQEKPKNYAVSIIMAIIWLSIISLTLIAIIYVIKV